MEVGWIRLSVEHVGKCFKRLLVGFRDGVHQFEGCFRTREI